MNPKYKKYILNIFELSPKPIKKLIVNVYTICKYKSLTKRSISIADYCSTNGILDYHYLDKNRKSVATAPIYYPSEDVVSEMVDMPETYWVKLNDISVIGGSSAIVTEDYILYDRFLSNNVNYTDNAFNDTRSKYLLDPEVKVYYSLRFDKKIETAISLLCNYSANYYHFCFEVLAKLWLLKRIDSIDKGIPLLVDECVINIPQFKKYFDILNGDRDYISIPWRELVQVKNAYILSNVNVIPPNFIDSKKIRNNDVLFDFSFIDYLRRTMLKECLNGKFESLGFNSDRIFISRKGLKHRKYNENDIEEIASKYNFMCFSPELYSIEEQIHIYSNSNVILAPSGAALTNIIYCKPGTKILVFTGVKLDLSIFSSIAAHLKLDMSYLAGDLEINNIQTNFKMDLTIFEEWLRNKIN